MLYNFKIEVNYSNKCHFYSLIFIHIGGNMFTWLCSQRSSKVSSQLAEISEKPLGNSSPQLKPENLAGKSQFVKDRKRLNTQEANVLA